MEDGRLARGMEIRREVMGDAYVDRASGSATQFNQPFQDLVGEYCWGWLWDRDALPRQTRSLVCIAMLSLLNRPSELKGHVRGALNNGCTQEEIREVLLHAPVYGGVPCGSDSFRVVREALDAIAAEEAA